MHVVKDWVHDRLKLVPRCKIARKGTEVSKAGQLIHDNAEGIVQYRPSFIRIYLMFWSSLAVLVGSHRRSGYSPSAYLATSGRYVRRGFAYIRGVQVGKAFYLRILMKLSARRVLSVNSCWRIIDRFVVIKIE